MAIWLPTSTVFFIALCFLGACRGESLRVRARVRVMVRVGPWVLLHLCRKQTASLGLLPQT